MKSSPKNLKRKSFVFLSILSSVVLVSCFVFSSVSVNADGTYIGIGNDEFDSWVHGASHSSNGYSISAHVPNLNVVVPFDTNVIDGESISVRLGNVIVNPNLTNNTLSYSGSIDTDFPTYLSMPYVANTRITGDYSFYVVFASPNVEAYSFDGRPFRVEGSTDLSQRFSLYLDNPYIAEGVRVDLLPSNSNFGYRVTVHFEDYLTTGTGVLALLDIPLRISYNFSFTAPLTPILDANGVATNTYTQPLTAVLFPVRPTFNNNQANINIQLPQFYLSNEYYTLLSALNNSDLNDIDDILTQVRNLLTAWLGTNDPLYISFPDFTQSLLTALGTLVSNSSVDYSSQLATIIGQLANIYANQLSIAQDVSDTESYCYDIAQYMNFLYTFVSGRHYMDNPGSGAIEANNMYYLLYSLAVGLTGDYQFSVSGQRDPDMAQLTYDRWVEIIRDAIGDGLTDASLRLDVAKVSSEESDYHAIEVSVWDDIFSVLDSHPGYLTFWEAYMDAPSAIQGAGVWYVGQIEDLWERIGWITYIISTILIAGVLVLFLGKINQFK